MTSLAELLTRETELVSRFLGVLGREQEALKSGTPQLLEGISSEKLALVEQLNRIEAERRQIAPPSGKGDDPAGITTWLAQHPHDRKVAPLWDALIGLARDAKALHELNGQLINMRLKRTAEALAVLEQHRKEHSLYGSNGQARATTGSRIVDSA